MSYLTVAYAIEQQALAQLRTAPDIVGEAALASYFREHLLETERLCCSRVRSRTLPASSPRTLTPTKRSNGRAATLCDRILPQERAMADRVVGAFDRALQASLAAQGVVA